MVVAVPPKGLEEGAAVEPNPVLFPPNNEPPVLDAPNPVDRVAGAVEPNPPPKPEVPAVAVLFPPNRPPPLVVVVLPNPLGFAPKPVFVFVAPKPVD